MLFGSLVQSLINEFGLDDNSIDWSKECSIAKKLLNNFKDEDILYSFSYYKNKGMIIKTLGFFVYHDSKYIKEALSYKENQLKSKELEDGDSGTRNQQRIAINSKARDREESYFDLFEKS